ncbi:MULTISPECIES: hypothetical protein [unclassified Dyella]|uniref:hypothetical protein n=1 Tax=unclassified Dyella TaxID=2634549 RepID=UPI003F8DECE1
MNDFISIDIESGLSDGDVFAIFSEALPGFTWRRGDSDAQGPYVSGIDSQGVKIQCWTGESPMAMSVSFRAAKVDDEARELLANTVLEELVPRIGRPLP